MTIETHMKRGIPIVFTVLLIFSAVELSISGWLVSRHNAHHNFGNHSVRDRVRFLLFCSAWTVFFSILFILLFFILAAGSIVTNVAVYLLFFFMTWVFWLSGAASFAKSIGGSLDCKLQKEFAYCGQLNALEAFAWIIWVIVTFAFVVVILRGITAARRGDGYRASIITA